MPYHLLGDTPNVVVDGSPTDSTVLTLSHWPGMPTPEELLDDLSAQIAFRALDRPDLLAGIDAVSNNHYDQDGMVSALALIEPDAARAREELLIDVAAAGDFATFRFRDAARVTFALAAYDDPERSPLDPDIFRHGYEHQCGQLYLELLPRLVGMVDDVETVKPLWEAEDAHLHESLHAIARDVVTIDEQPDLDLAVVTVPVTWADQMISRFTISRTAAVHPVAVNSSTSQFRVLTIHGQRYRLEMRYESWVMYRSRPVLPRPDLRLLAAALQEIEPTDVEWSADAPGALTPTLRHTGDESGIVPVVLRREVEHFLASSPPAWDPYAGR